MGNKAMVIALTVVLLGFGLVCPAPAQSLDELYRLARQEGQVALYGGGPARLYTGWAKLFEERFPGIKVNVRGDRSAVLAENINSEIKAGKLEADLTMLQTIQDFVRWKKEGALLPFKPDGFEKIPSAFKDDDGMYVGIGVYGLAYSHNPKLVDRQDMPKSARGFLDPKFAGKVITTYPHDDDVTLYLYHTIVQKHGWQFMDGFMKNQPAFIKGHLGVDQKIAAGQFALTFDAATVTTLSVKSGGGSIELVFPEEDPLPIWAQTAAIFKGAPHPNAARLYLAWYLSREQQYQMNRTGSWSPRTDVDPPTAFKPLSQHALANSFRELITDEAKVVELRKRFERYIGPVKGEMHR